MQTLKAPQGITGGVNVGGQWIAIDANGFAQVPHSFDATQLLGLGFKVVAQSVDQAPAADEQ